MLARTLKTHEELGLQKHEYDALVTTLYMIEDGQIKPELIHMKSFTEHLGCGTAHCLAGWASTVDETAFPEVSSPLLFDRAYTLSQRLPKPLLKLFWIGPSRDQYPEAEAPARLRTYLETGRCD